MDREGAENRLVVLLWRSKEVLEELRATEYHKTARLAEDAVLKLEEALRRLRRYED